MTIADCSFIYTKDSVVQQWVTIAVKKRLLILLFLFTAGQLSAQTGKEKTNTAHPQSANTYTYKIITSHSTYGYDIYANEKLCIHQLAIPAVPGNKGFATRLAAERTAQKVIDKMRKGEMPPTLSQEELRDLHVL